ncbi:glycosyltransferase family 2 protein [Gluconobacter thailandicus]|uniref:glycosyltransferase family 2 protein n=1 Tax=Gluconobacter thailandicus TaxID=257438 RepID=UPI000A659E60|nr:glycosyltransferase family 2 protein [Gluconobacter thailandicus]
MIKKPLAVVTMVYNEPEHLLAWRRHYGAQVGEQACYVIDHGSTDGSTDLLGQINRIRIPRSPQDDERRTRAVGKFCDSLLEWYESVIYVDVDELLLADPALFPSLTHFAQANIRPVVTATGLDVIHRPESEAALDYTRLVSFQRQHVRFSSAMCKPVLIRTSVTWAPGFHCCAEMAPEMGAPLFLFHLRYADLPSGLNRLERTRTQPWCSNDVGQHQRLANQDWENMLRGMADLPVVETTFDQHDQRLQNWRQAVEDSTASRIDERYRLDLHLNGTELWRLPERFVGRI